MLGAELGCVGEGSLGGLYQSLHLPKRLKPAPYTELMPIAQWLFSGGLGRLASSLEEERGDPGRYRGEGALETSESSLQPKRVNSMPYQSFPLRLRSSHI